jgi:ATP-dependent Zn protease
MSQLSPQVPPQYPPHLAYYAPTPPQPLPPPKRPFRGYFGWVLFLGLAVILFLLMSQRAPEARYPRIALSELATRLEAGEVQSLVVEGDEARGRFVQPRTLPSGQTSSDFRCQLPEGAGGDWHFFEWLLEHRGEAEVSVMNSSTIVMNILLPLIPWLLIFFFIWFFVFRQLRNVGRSQQMVITGPGRWVPDPSSSQATPS